jgi:hypothetical protein
LRSRELKPGAATVTDEIRLHLATEKLSSRHVGVCGTRKKLAQHRPWILLSGNLQLCENERATAKDGFIGAKCWTQIRFIRPPFCARCGLPFQGDLTTKFECTNCREMELHFSSARSAVVAKAVVLEAIHRFKYLRHLWFENFLADLLIREAGPELRGQKWDFIVPVPLHSLKQPSANSTRPGSSPVI